MVEDWREIASGGNPEGAAGCERGDASRLSIAFVGAGLLSRLNRSPERVSSSVGRRGGNFKLSCSFASCSRADATKSQRLVNFVFARFGDPSSASRIDR